MKNNKGVPKHNPLNAPEVEIEIGNNHVDSKVQLKQIEEMNMFLEEKE